MPRLQGLLVRVRRLGDLLAWGQGQEELLASGWRQEEEELLLAWTRRLEGLLGQARPEQQGAAQRLRR